MSFYLLICDIYFFSWVKYLLKSFALSRNIRLFVSLVLGFESYLHILKTNLCQLCGLRSLSPSLWQIWGLSYRVASWGTERLNNSPRLHGIWRIKIGFNLKSVLFATLLYFLCRHSLGQVETKLDNQMTRSQSNTTPLPAEEASKWPWNSHWESYQWHQPEVLLSWHGELHCRTFIYKWRASLGSLLDYIKLITH